MAMYQMVFVVQISQFSVSTEMDKITDVTTEEMGESKYIRPFRVQYTQNNTKKIWDCIQSHDSVAILIHHIERECFIAVRQFRPAVYISEARKMNNGDTPKKVDMSSLPGSQGITYECCAGIIDRDVSAAEIAQQEILEECGYQVPLDRLEVITKSRGGVGTAGTEQTLYYAQVTEDMKKHSGGGIAHEGEMIEVTEIPVKDSLAFALDESKIKPVGMVLAIMWFHMFKSNQGKE